MWCIVIIQQGASHFDTLRVFAPDTVALPA